MTRGRTERTETKSHTFFGWRQDLCEWRAVQNAHPPPLEEAIQTECGKWCSVIKTPNEKEQKGYITTDKHEEVHGYHRPLSPLQGYRRRGNDSHTTGHLASAVVSKQGRDLAFIKVNIQRFQSHSAVGVFLCHTRQWGPWGWEKEHHPLDPRMYPCDSPIRDTLLNCRTEMLGDCPASSRPMGSTSGVNGEPPTPALSKCRQERGQRMREQRDDPRGQRERSHQTCRQVLLISFLKMIP